MKIALFTVILPELTPEKVAHGLAEHGYDGVEWRVHKDYHIPPDCPRATIRAIARLTHEHGLEVSNLGAYVPAGDVEGVKRLVAAAVGLGCPRVRLAGFEYTRDTPFQEQHEAVREKLLGIRPILADARVKALIETHHGTLAPSASGARRLLEGLPPDSFGVIYDPGNMIIEGREDCRMGLEILGDYLAYVHVKNCVWRPSGGRWCHQWAALREGMVDWPDTVAALKACGYEGYLSVENLYQVPLFRGLVGEVTGSDGAVRPVTDRLQEDIAYLRAIERTIREEARPRATRG